MLVTCYYDLYQNPDSFQKYLDLFTPLGNSGLAILLFVDPSDVERFVHLPSTVQVVGLSLTDLELHQIAMNYDRELPAGRTPSKDTKEFFALMNSKIEFVKKASEMLPEVNQFLWIDFGILKIVKNTERFLSKLEEIETKVFVKMAFPGCWSAGRYFTVDSINWRFCGGFFVMPRAHLLNFFQHSKNVLTDFCTQAQYKLTWETNVWNIIELFAERDNIDWYFADHNDTIVTNIDYLLKTL